MTKKDAEKIILKAIKDSPRPLCTKEISNQLKIAWHTAERYCFKLQLQKKIDSFTIGKTNAWFIKK